MCAVAGVCKEPVKPHQLDQQKATMNIIGMSLILSVITASVWMMLLQAFPEQMVVGTMYLYAAIFFAIDIAYVANGGSDLVTIGVWLLFGLLFLATTCCLREQLRFTAKIVKGVSTVYSRHRTIFFVAIMVMLLQVSYIALCTVASLIPIASQVLVGGDGVPDKQSGEVAILILFCTYWGCQVFSNILHVACAGVIARYYFNEQVETAVRKSTWQAFTSYLGPIAFGSFLMAIIETLKHLVKRLRNAGRREQSAAVVCLATIAACFLDCLESIMKVFNCFCYVIVSIYGTSFCQSGKEVIRLFSDAKDSRKLIAWNYCGLVCFMANFVGGALVCLICTGAAWGMGIDSLFLYPIGLCSFFIAYVVMMVVARVMESGCDTLIVCYVEEPYKLDSAAPEVSAAFRDRIL
jgi:hypothetical protein